jgi:hypothetical protein
MTVPVEDSNTTTAPIATQPHIGGNPSRCTPQRLWSMVSRCQSARATRCRSPGALRSPSTAAARSRAGVRRSCCSGIVPAGGYLICNNSPHPLYASDVGAATPPGGTAIHIPPHATLVTPPGYAPQQAVSLYGPTTGQSFAARRW